MKKSAKSAATKAKTEKEAPAVEGKIIIDLTEEQMATLKKLAEQDPSKEPASVAKKLLLEIIANNWRAK